MIQAAFLFLQGAAGLGSAYYGMEAGEIEAQQFELSAKQEQINATIRSNERMNRLVDAMALNNASLAARGITSGGSPSAILQADYQRMSDETQADLLDSKNVQLSLRGRAAASRFISKANAATSLLGTTIDIAKTGM